MDSKYYKASGKFLPTVFIYYLIAALVAIPVLGCIYTHLIYYMPFIYANILVTIGAAFVLGYILSKVINAGKCRNTSIASILSIISVVLMKYVTWAFYVPLVYVDAYEIVELSFVERLQLSWVYFIDPAAVFEGMYDISTIGVWSVFSIVFKGPILYAVWIAEICIFIFACNILARSAAKEPFCEETNQWFRESKKEIKLSPQEDIQQFKANIEAGQTRDFADLLGENYQGKEHYLSVTFYYLDDIAYGYMTIKEVQIVVDEKGKEKETKEDIFEYIRIEADVMSIAKLYIDK